MLAGGHLQPVSGNIQYMLAYLLAGVVAGFFSAVVALLLGHGGTAALACYSLFGILGFAATVVLRMLLASRSAIRNGKPARAARKRPVRVV